MTAETFDARKRLLRLIGEYPGLHLRELAREARLSEALAGYHLGHLVAAGHVVDRAEHGFRRFYPVKGPALSERDLQHLSLLRQPVPLQIVVRLAERSPATHQELTDMLGLAKSTVSYHLAKLQEAGVVAPAVRGAGFVLRDARHVERLLLRWEPPADLTERFQSMWRRFYAGHRRHAP